jgi:two-component system, OmpR family, KDP operon response regulator KdpE
MTNSSGNILIVDDDFSIRNALRATLSSLGFGIEEAATGEEGIAMAGASHFDAVLLDINMPGIGGTATCQKLRQLAPALPILMLTVRDSQEDVIRALDAGADDYITKPFHIRELAARLRAAVRRNRSNAEPPARLLIGDVELDAARRIVKKSGVAVHLTPKEFDLLHHLMLQAGMPVNHSKLLQAVWGPEYGGELEYLRTFVRQLRVKIEDDPSHPTYLLTEACVGYRFCEPMIETQASGRENV